ncbi:hypothetical protein THASP1DRAFT_30861 [Thamnocephalis sphaerospora]|uniref:Protein kinase domain-containing protein n=1 Tax=Thamnocephalis sphaerospora TaxID=78915 RepID=A0A4P9XN30_9FUNG|nr:hypothetical protein THASP1DRAFT_30861 [Thamnocephalis sphaerospora]|eukprot:RKP07315.1 hypothetical protein THASP1DRAFT_30861 [Thamnocephalis sphaerospora]
MTPKEKDRFLPPIIVQVVLALQYLDTISFVHEKISLDNIMIRKDMAEIVPQVVITDLHLVSGVYKYSDSSIFLDSPLGGRSEKASYERGYRPPEDYDFSQLVDQRKRLSWMLGATIYAALTGHPPYGFAFSLNDVNPWTERKLSSVMLNLITWKQNSYPPITTSHNRPLLRLMETLMTCEADKRLTISRLDPTLLPELADSSDLKAKNKPGPLNETSPSLTVEYA